MSDELFPVASVQMDSPRLAWLKRHGVITWHDTGLRDGVRTCEPEWFCGFQHWWPGQTGIEFFAAETAHNGDSRIGLGDTEDKAIVQFLTCGEARSKNLKLWNEEAVG